MDRDRSFTRAALASMPKRNLRFHVVALTHLPVREYYSGCAYTQKIRRLCRLLTEQLGHTVFLYALENSDTSICTEHITTHTLADVRSVWGDKDYDGDEELGYDWKATCFRNDFDKPTWITSKYLENATAGILKRRRDDDILLVTMGRLHEPIARAVNLQMTCEPGIGYSGVFAPFLAFESTSQRDYVKGARQGYDDRDGSNYDRVIPNYYYPEEFAYKPREERGDYYLFIGRLIHRKGYGVAIDVARHTNVRLLMAGQGVKEYDAETRRLVTDEGEERTLPPNVEYIGFADAKRRSELMSNAIAVFTPTLFREPFCGVAVEAQMCGTPVITSSYGAFAETVEQARTGFRCFTVNDYVVATRIAPTLDTAYIRDRAHAMFGAANVALMYEKWFHDLYDVYLSTSGKSSGWYEVHAPSFVKKRSADNEADDDDDDGAKAAAKDEPAASEVVAAQDAGNATTSEAGAGSRMRAMRPRTAPAASTASSLGAPSDKASNDKAKDEKDAPKPRIAPETTTMVPRTVASGGGGSASGGAKASRNKAFAGRRVAFASPPATSAV